MAVVFIPTRNRHPLLARVLPKWLEQKNLEELFLVVERREYNATKAFLRANSFTPGGKISVLKLPKSDQGINYSRAWIISQADYWNLPRIIQADDDIYPRPDSDVERLFNWKGLKTLGIGVMVPFYGLMFGNQTIKDENRPLMSKGALGKRLFSLNVRKVQQIGNFDVSLHSGWGDDELVRQGMHDLQATWYVHAGVWATSIAGRYTQGGINDLHGEDEQSRLAGQRHSHRIIYARWGSDYISNPKTSIRLVCRWKKFMTDFVPDWESRIDWERR